MGQGGNVWEWSETELDLVNDHGSSVRGAAIGTSTTPSASCPHRAASTPFRRSGATTEVFASQASLSRYEVTLTVVVVSTRTTCSTLWRLDVTRTSIVAGRAIGGGSGTGKSIAAVRRDGGCGHTDAPSVACLTVKPIELSWPHHQLHGPMVAGRIIIGKIPATHNHVRRTLPADCSATQEHEVQARIGVVVLPIAVTFAHNLLTI